MADPTAYPSLAQATRVWARIGLLSFGGPAGQIALMHRELVEERRWIGDRRFLHALNFCMLLPGPEAMQLATYVGWLMHGLRGALVAGGLFVLPGAVTIMLLSALYAAYGQVGLVETLFFGLKAAVLAIVVQAVVRLCRRVLGRPAPMAVAAAAFLALFALAMPFPLVILGAAMVGWLASLAGSTGFSGGGHGPQASVVDDADTLLGATTARPAGGALVAGIGALLLWLGPVAVLLAWGGVFADIASFFSRLAVLTFGGAYAVLAWVAQEAVGRYAWLAPGEMLDGLGLAETTPGPLILVLQFVGFLAAWRDAGTLSPLVAGLLGGGLTLWVTFLPCFAWIFLGAPFMERLHHAPRLSAALAAVTAAVVGVVLNLAIWFAVNTVFAETRLIEGGPFQVTLPVLSSIDGAAAALVAASLVAALRFHVGIVPLMTGCAGAALALRGLGLI